MVGGSNPPSATSPLDGLARRLDAGARRLLIPDDAQLVLAVSGGPDSIALLHAAAHLVATGVRAWRLRVAHLDHRLRRESAEDARFVTAITGALGIPLDLEAADVAALARSEHRSLEDAGREARYRFLERVAPDGALIVTAHTLDDRAETVVLNLLRGAGLAGTVGIPARRGRIVRPLLEERREALRELLDAAGVPYRLDPSNAHPAFARNRVRNELVPLLEALRPGAVDRIARFARLAADDDRLLDELAGADLERRRAADGSITWRDPPPPALGRRILRLALGDPAPPAERIEALVAAAAGDHGGVRVELGAGRVASVRGRTVRIERE